MNERKVIEKAKWLLVEKMKMSEPEAIRYIQKRAMNLRLPQLRVAEGLIETYK
ncbi:hypothetical protein SDC9_197883 [bioreactor metagenome]|uniref:ANTAR domain-containing protein n=1 Tax=bioreactor metagenome TaxID=1076179 RepID=A0A645IG38_9ZZZZ